MLDRPSLKILLFCIAAFALSIPAYSQVQAIRFGKLIDGNGQALKERVVLIEGSQIVALADDWDTVPERAQRVDLSDYTGLPGLIDVHVHLSYYWDQQPGTNPWNQLKQQDTSLLLHLTQQNARKTLASGVTLVRDLHSVKNIAIRMRGLIEAGAMMGPRMLVAACGIQRTETPICGAYWPGSQNLRDVVEEQLTLGADWIKVFASTGSADDLTGNQTFSYEDLRTVVTVAHEQGRKVAAHSYGKEAAKDAVRAGVASIEHAVDLDDETLRQMFLNGTVYVPTIDHNRYYADHAIEFGYSAEKVEELRRFVQQNLETLRRAHKAGVKIAMGSDAVFTMFGENTRELEWFVRAGMTPAQVIEAAIKNGAELLDVSEVTGKLAPGRFADLIAVQGDPLTDVGALVNGVRWVMKGGRIVFDRRR